MDDGRCLIVALKFIRDVSFRCMFFFVLQEQIRQGRFHCCNKRRQKKNAYRQDTENGLGPPLYVQLLNRWSITKLLFFVSSALSFARFGL